MALVDHGAAVMVRDAEAADKLMPEALALVKDDAKLQKLSANISKWHCATPSATSLTA